VPYLTETKYTSTYSVSYIGVIGVNANQLPKTETATTVLKKIVGEHATGDWHLKSKRLPAPPKPKGIKRAPHAAPDRGKYEVIIFFAEQADFNALNTILKGKTSAPSRGALGCFGATMP
jgi:hypothetical protein